MSKEMEDNLVQSLGILSSGGILNNDDFNNLCVERLASITKIYEMHDPSKWVIYDSYCVLGLQKIIKKYWVAVGTEKNHQFLRLPWPPGRSGEPINGFPRTGDTAPKQKRLGFLYASWLCRGIADYLNNSREPKRDFVWKAYHIEMAAFQLGHEK